MEEANEASAAENDARSATVVGGTCAQGLLERCALVGVFEGGDDFGDGLNLRFGGLASGPFVGEVGFGGPELRFGGLELRFDGLASGPFVGDI